MPPFLSRLKKRLRLLTLSKQARRHALVGPPHLWEMKRAFQIQLLTQQGLKSDHFLFDIGCGTLRGGIPIIDYLENGRYFGSDVRQHVLDEAHKELQAAGLENKNPTLLFAPDISQLSLPQQFDYIWAFAVLIHMHDAILEDTLRFVRDHLAPDGVFYATVNIGEPHEGHWQGFPVVTRSFTFYEQACARHRLDITDAGTLHQFGHETNDLRAREMQKLVKIVHATTD